MTMTRERLEEIRKRKHLMADSRLFDEANIVGELIAEVERLQGALIAVGVEVLVDASRQAKVAKSIKERS